MPLTLDQLPDELIIHVLLQPSIDLETLYSVARVSQRLYMLAMCVLRLYKLPHVQLQSVVDQEGHGKSTTFFEFKSLDHDTLMATFVVQKVAPKRYYRDKSREPPVLRHISMTDSNDNMTKSNMRSGAKMVLRQQSWMTVDTFISQSSEGSNVSDKDCASRSDLWEDDPINIISPSRTRQLNVRKSMVRVIQSRQASPAEKCLQTRPSWRLAYYVGDSDQGEAVEALCKSVHNPDTFFGWAAVQQPEKVKTKKQDECYVSPAVLTVHLSLICQSRRNKKDTRWVQAVDWIKGRCGVKNVNQKTS
ncbi:hypothetical protein CLU79DRAFT_729735 [Phycomyces nitens]|nr:hypothetical protein CLU79DRAFT_729735 [Phycomyces nitens]